MRSSEILHKDKPAGRLWEDDRGFFYFQYSPEYLAGDQPPLTPNLPKRSASFTSSHLFPIFYNMLAEGELRKLQEQTFKLSPGDHFGLLRATARYDTIGAITVHETTGAYAE